MIRRKINFVERITFHEIQNTVQEVVLYLKNCFYRLILYLSASEKYNYSFVAWIILDFLHDLKLFVIFILTVSYLNLLQNFRANYYCHFAVIIVIDINILLGKS